MIISSKLSLSLSLRLLCAEEGTKKWGRFQAPERHVILPPVSPLLSLIPDISLSAGLLGITFGNGCHDKLPPLPHSLHTTQLDHEAFLFSTALILRAIDVYISPHLSFSLSLHALLLK